MKSIVTANFWVEIIKEEGVYLGLIKSIHTDVQKTGGGLLFSSKTMGKWWLNIIAQCEEQLFVSPTNEEMTLMLQQIKQHPDLPEEPMIMEKLFFDLISEVTAKIVISELNPSPVFGNIDRNCNEALN